MEEMSRVVARAESLEVGRALDGSTDQGQVEPAAGSGPLGRAAAHERGMVSAEWAVGIIAAVAIAGVLLAVVTTGQVKSALLHVILTVIGTFARFAS